MSLEPSDDPFVFEPASELPYGNETITRLTCLCEVLLHLSKNIEIQSTDKFSFIGLSMLSIFLSLFNFPTSIREYIKAICDEMSSEQHRQHEMSGNKFSISIKDSARRLPRLLCHYQLDLTSKLHGEFILLRYVQIMSRKIMNLH